MEKLLCLLCVYYHNIEKEHYSNKKTMEKTVMQETAIEI